MSTNPPAANEGGEKVVEMPKRPAIAAQITIVMYDDGNMQVDGPFEDRILFRGLLDIARDVEFAEYQKRIGRKQAEMERLAKMPWWKRKLLERKAKQQAEAAEQARRDALAKTEKPKDA